jgi:hypothetical protein
VYPEKKRKKKVRRGKKKEKKNQRTNVLRIMSGENEPAWRRSVLKEKREFRFTSPRFMHPQFWISLRISTKEEEE